MTSMMKPYFARGAIFYVWNFTLKEYSTTKNYTTMANDSSMSNYMLMYDLLYYISKLTIGRCIHYICNQSFSPSLNPEDTGLLSSSLQPCTWINNTPRHRGVTVGGVWMTSRPSPNPSSIPWTITSRRAGASAVYISRKSPTLAPTIFVANPGMTPVQSTVEGPPPLE